MVRPSNGFLSALSADDYELIRAHLRTVDLPHDAVLVETGETLKRAYFPHRGVISLVVKLAKGEHVQVAMIGRDSLLGTLSTMGDAGALNTAVVLVPGAASMMDLDRLRVAAEQSLHPADVADTPRARGLRAGAADCGLQRGASGGVTAVTLPAAHP